MMSRAPVAMILLVLAAPVTAQTFGLPQGCTAYVTVQMRGCQVSHLFHCDGDPPGHQRRAILDDAGLSHVSVIDAETQWIESWDVGANQTGRLLPGAADPASLTTLLATGRDAVEFVTRTDDSYDTVFRGHDALTGQTVVIDGITLSRTTFEVVASDPAGNERWRVSGAEYIHRDWRSFLAGTRTITTPDDSFDQDHTPVAFIFPGEPGFLASTPRHECGVMLSKAAGQAAMDSVERN